MATRVLVVDDSALARNQLASIVTDDLSFELAGSAEHGLQAVDLAEAVRPDLVTLDVRMPVMNGLTALKHIMSRRPVPVVMVSAFTRDDSHLTFDCLRCGALDFVPKPSQADADGGDAQRHLIAQRLRRAASVDAPRSWYCRLQRATPPTAETRHGETRRLLLVAGGRGSISPVLKIFNSLPPRSEVAALVVLDLPAAVVESLTRYLARFSSLAVTSVSTSVRVQPGRVYLVPGAMPHIVVSEQGQLRLQRLQTPTGLTPFVLTTALAASCVDACNGNVTFVLLSGASAGFLSAMQTTTRGRTAGLVQAPDTTLEPEVPQAAVARGLADVVADPVELSSAVAALLAGAA